MVVVPEEEEEAVKMVALEALLGYTFVDKSLVVQAMTHPSTNTITYRGCGDYQRLEFLGDAVVDVLVMTTLFHHHPSWTPEELTNHHHEVVGNQSLASWGMTRLEVDRFIRSDSIDLNEALTAARRRSRRGGGGGASTITSSNGGSSSSSSSSSGSSTGGGGGGGGGGHLPKAMADVVESLVAAVYLDTEGDMERVAQLFLPLIMGGDGGMGGGQGDEEEGGPAANGGDDEGRSSGMEGDDDGDGIVARLQAIFPSLGEVLALLGK